MTASLLAVGISHQDAGVDVREAVYLDEEGRARLRMVPGKFRMPK